MQETVILNVSCIETENEIACECFVENPCNSKRVSKAIIAISNESDVPETQHMQETDILNVPCIETENEIAKYNSLHDQYLKLVYNCITLLFLIF